MKINQHRFNKTGVRHIVLHIKMVEEMTKANYSEY